MSLAIPLRSTTKLDCSGYCSLCATRHFLNQGESQSSALTLMAELEKKGRIDLHCEATKANPLSSLDYIFGPARGQMFGILEYRAPDGCHGVLRAFSGQYNGQWQVAGWAPPLFDVDEWQQANQGQERQIKDLSRRIDLLAPEDPCRRQLFLERRSLSQQLMKKLHAIYRLTNFCGQVKTLQDVFQGTGGIPNGTGDCCAPKLLNYAAQNQLTPLGISEFYLGLENLSQTRQHGKFYSSCAGKCRPILGFLLCGLDNYNGS